MYVSKCVYSTILGARLGGCGLEPTVVLDESTVAEDGTVPHHEGVPRGTSNQLNFVSTSECILQYIHTHLLLLLQHHRYIEALLQWQTVCIFWYIGTILWDNKEEPFSKKLNEDTSFTRTPFLSPNYTIIVAP